MIRVLIADDVATSRKLLAAIFAMAPEFTVVGEAVDGEEAVRLAATLAPDLVTMDIEMPGMDGLEATRRIMATSPRPILIVSGLDLDTVAISLNAVRAGALAVTPKPPGPGAPEFATEAQNLLTLARAMSQVHLLPVVSGGAPRPVPAAARDHRARVIAIAASTGGPPALDRILSELPADFRAPILVVQHIAQGFSAGLAQWLGASSKLAVKLAADGDVLQQGTVYIAPDTRHMGVEDGCVRLADGPSIDGYKPSGNHLFESVARAYGAATLAVILSGMGRDGVNGLAAVRAAGGIVVAQDRESSVIFGMNGEAVLGGLTDEVLPLDALGYFLMQAV